MQQEQVTLQSLLCGDLASCIISCLGRLEDVAALELSLKPLPRALMDAVNTRVSVILKVDWAGCRRLPLDFEKECLWPADVSAANWHPLPLLASMRSPAYCKVTGSGQCMHGLCQKQEEAKPGVMQLLARIASETAGASPPQRALALECSACLDGALGRNDAARHTWARAAAAGSAPAQLDIGIREFRSAAGSDGAMLRCAADNESIEGVQRAMTRARCIQWEGRVFLKSMCSFKV